MANGQVVGARLPTFLVVGTRKAATTTLWAHLRAHPACFVSDVKEVHFFDEDDRWGAGLDAYRPHFAAAGDAEAVGDVSPTYMCAPEWLDRVRATVPDARLVAVLRDPVARLVSHVEHLVRERKIGRDPVPAIEAELADERRDPRGLVAAGQYGRHLAALRERFDDDQLLVLLYEDLRADVAATMRRVFRHLGVDPDVQVDADLHANAAYDVRSWRLHRWLFQHPVPRRWPKLAAPVIRWNTVEHRFEPPARLRSRLEATFAPDVAAVEAHLGRSLAGVWSTPSA